jgi:hypothetical protein
MLIESKPILSLGIINEKLSIKKYSVDSKVHSDFISLIQNKIASNMFYTPSDDIAKILLECNKLDCRNVVKELKKLVYEDEY